VLSLGDLPTQLQNQAMEARRAVAETAGAEADCLNRVTPLAETEKKAILNAIRILNGDKLKAAKLLGIGKTTLYRKLKEYGIADPLNDG
jgi:two-component system response regulator HydG